jgi:hypothetical protein
MDSSVTCITKALRDEIGYYPTPSTHQKLSDPVVVIKDGHLSVDKAALTSIAKRIFEVAGEGPLTRTRENGTTIELKSAEELAPLRQEYAAYKAEVEKAAAAKVGHSR